jgi:hypothetical protein
LRNSKCRGLFHRRAHGQTQSAGGRCNRLHERIVLRAVGLADGSRGVSPKVVNQTCWNTTLSTSQCVSGRRIGSEEKLREETTAWHEEINSLQRGVEWQMKIDDARIKLKSINPKIKLQQTPSGLSTLSLRVHGWLAHRCFSTAGQASSGTQLVRSIRTDQ